MSPPLVLGLETSCDETAAAIVEGPSRVLSSVIATQHDLHERYAGVVPEIASRAHLERLMPVLREALAAARVELARLDAISVGHRPGLIGSLLVGTSAAKTLAWSLNLPVIGVDHIAAHLHACTLDDSPADFPALGLVVSGGHTSLFLLDDPLSLRRLGRTIDDAVGEAFDKAGSMLGLGYPGGPAVERVAAEGDELAHDLPVARLGRDRLDFSFSGLKTALLYAIHGPPQRGGGRPDRDAATLTPRERADFAASFQRAAITALTTNVRRALERHDVRCLLVGGGVCANNRLRAALTEVAGKAGVPLRLPPPSFCIDNAAMIAGLGAVKLAGGGRDGWGLVAATHSAFEGDLLIS